MNGEEAAAASLFGSEDSGSDLFATLGADTTSPQPSLDDIFSNETALIDTKADTYDFLSGSQNYEAYTSEFPEYASQPTEALAHTTADNANFTEPPVASHWSKYAVADDGSQHNVAPSGYHDATQSTAAAYNNYQPSTYSVPPSTYPSYGSYDPSPQTQAPSTTSSTYGNYSAPAPVQSYAPHNAYDPPSTTQSSYASYVPPSTKTPSYAPYDKPVAMNTRSSYSAYDPPAPGTTHTNYSAYDPPTHKGPLTQSNNSLYNPPPSNPTPQTQPYHKPENVYASSSAETYPSYSKPYAQPDAHPPPPPPPVKAIITRPKVSNAYDPPFPVTLPTRRGSRPAAVSAQQAYAQYDKPIEPTPPQTRPGNGIVQPAFSNDEFDLSRHSATHTNYGQYTDRMSPGPSQDEKHHGIQNSANTVPDADSSSFFANHESAHINDGFPEDGFANHTMVPNHKAEDNSHSQESTTVYKPPTSRSNTPFSNQQPTSPKQSKLASPASIPLPYSPLEDVQQHAYTPQVGPKKEAAPAKDLHDLYAPKMAQNSTNYIPRTSSPLAVHNARQNEPKRSYTIPPINSNSMSPPPFGAVPKQPLGTNLTSANQYAPPININHNIPVSRQTSQWSETSSGAQELLVKPTTGLYAPSPSLIGANDPLSRTSARAPVINFGFGGKIITCFHGMPGLNAGFDVAFSSRTTSELKIRTLHKILPQSALNGVDSSYPGPLLADPGPTSLSLVRPNVATQTKTKKASVLNYLAGRISEIHQGLGYLSSAEKRTAEDKLILVKLLSVMVENDGRLLGTPQAEAAVRSTLVPRLEGTQTLQDAVSLQASFSNTSSNEVPISITTLRSSTLDKIEEFLLQGDRRQAFQYAEEQKLWAHAMVIASSIDKESWKEVVHDFIRAELAPREEPENNLLAPGGGQSDSQPQKNNRESLRVAYSLFSGQGPAAIQEMAPTSLLQRSLGRFQPPMVAVATPRTPNFGAMQSVNIPPSVPSASLATWAETVAMIMSSVPTPETSSALTALGDQLLANSRVEAAHVCYLLSPQTSLLGGVGSPAARLALLGSKNPSDVLRDTDSLVFSEILEFAMSLVPVVKGQEPFHGIPHIQAYRFIKAVILAEVGEIQLANRYCEAITASLSQTSPYTNLAFLEQLQGLQQRLSGVFPGDKSGSWIGGKISKPSLDSIGGWLEGRFTKLVTGESDAPPSATDPSKTVDQPFAGPFAHYSNISNTPSARSSPQPQPLPPTTTMGPPQRTASAMATASTYTQQIHHVERSSSAMDHVRQRPSVSTYAPSTNSMPPSQSSPTGFGQNSHPNSSNPYAPKGPDSSSPNDESDTPIQTTSWWSSSNDANGSTITPTAATFMKIDESSVQASTDGFISLMDTHSYSVGPSQYASKAPSPAQAYNGNEDDDDDLGLGNSRPKPKPLQEENGTAKEEKPAAAIAAKPPTPAPAAPADNSAASSGSWLGRWWKKSDTPTPGPIKASLGEESAFYYDKEQKRWVNRKAGSAEAEKPATPPPPPSRSQTASPGMTGSKPQPPPGNGSAPPIRSASAVDLGEPPMKAPMRIRSNLAPPMESAPSTPTGTRLTPGPPPPARPRSQAAKRNIRSRYVDVLQPEGGTPSPQ